MGQPRKKVWAGEEVGHARCCKCRKCTGGRQKAKARKRENKVAKVLGGSRDALSGQLTGKDVTVGDICFIEETANKNLVAGIRRWWSGKQITAKMARTQEVGKRLGVPAVFVASWDNQPQVAVMDFDSLQQLIERVRQAEERSP